MNDDKRVERRFDSASCATRKTLCPKVQRASKRNTTKMRARPERHISSSFNKFYAFSHIMDEQSQYKNREI